MTQSTLTLTGALWAIGIAACYALWGMLAKHFGISGVWITAAILVGSVIGGIGAGYGSFRTMSMPTLLPLAVLFVAGLLNGAAMHFHAGKMTDPSIPAVSFVLVVIVTMIALTPLYDYVLNHQTVSNRQLIGLLLAGLTVYVLVG